MWKMIQTEWWKLRRCQILLVGIVALALCPVVQYGSQLIVNPEIRDPNYDMLHLFANVVWGNTQVFLPISLVMTGGWLIDRENTHDTMKNLLTVPVSYPRLLGGKLAVTGLLSLLFGTPGGQAGGHRPAVPAVRPLQRGRDGAHRDAGRPPRADARGDPPAGGTGGGCGADHLPGVCGAPTWAAPS